MNHEHTRKTKFYNATGKHSRVVANLWQKAPLELTAHGSPVPASGVTLDYGDAELNIPVCNDPSHPPRIVTMTDLGQRAGEVVSGIEEGLAALVTKHGRFVAAIVPVDSADVEQALLEMVAGRKDLLFVDETGSLERGVDDVDDVDDGGDEAEGMSTEQMLEELRGEADEQ